MLTSQLTDLKLVPQQLAQNNRWFYWTDQRVSESRSIIAFSVLSAWVDKTNLIRHMVLKETSWWDFGERSILYYQSSPWWKLHWLQRWPQLAGGNPIKWTRLPPVPTTRHVCCRRFFSFDEWMLTSERTVSWSKDTTPIDSVRNRVRRHCCLRDVRTL